MITFYIFVGYPSEQEWLRRNLGALLYIDLHSKAPLGPLSLSAQYTVPRNEALIASIDFQVKLYSVGDAIIFES